MALQGISGKHRTETAALQHTITESLKWQFGVEFEEKIFLW